MYFVQKLLVFFLHKIQVSYLSLVFNHNPSFCYSSNPETSEEYEFNITVQNKKFCL